MRESERESNAFHTQIHFLLRHMAKGTKRKKTQHKGLTKVKTRERGYEKISNLTFLGSATHKAPTFIGLARCQIKAPLNLAKCQTRLSWAWLCTKPKRLQVLQDVTPNILRPRITLDPSTQHENLRSLFPYTLAMQKTN